MEPKKSPEITGNHPANRRAFMRTSLASGVALSVPTFFSGLIRAHGGGGGGGGETTTDPWGTTECTDQTTYDTTWATTQETTLPETTVVTTVLPQRPDLFSFALVLWVAKVTPNLLGLSDKMDDAEQFTEQSNPIPYPELLLPDDPEHQFPYVFSHGPNPFFLKRDRKFIYTANPLKTGYPTFADDDGEPSVTHGYTSPLTGGSNYLHFFLFKVSYKWKYTGQN